MNKTILNSESLEVEHWSPFLLKQGYYYLKLVSDFTFPAEIAQKGILLGADGNNFELQLIYPSFGMVFVI